MIDLIFYFSYIISFIGSIFYFAEESRTDDAYKLINKVQFLFVSASVALVPFFNTMIMIVWISKRIKSDKMFFSVKNEFFKNIGW